MLLLLKISSTLTLMRDEVIIPQGILTSIEEVLEVSAVTFPAYEEAKVTQTAKRSWARLRVLDRSTSRGSTLDSECVDDNEIGTT